MSEIERCDKIREKREQLHSALHEKVKELLGEAKKRGYENKYYTTYTATISVNDESGEATAKMNDDIFLRVRWKDRGEIYYVSKFETPSAQVLVEGVRVLKAVIEKFNEGADRDSEELKKAEVELEAVRI